MASGIDIGSFVGSDFKGDDAIKKIMEAEKKTTVPLQNEKFRLQMQKQAWGGLQTKLSDLATATRDLLSPAYSAFRKIQTHSSNPDLLEISPQGIDPSKWSPANYDIIPKQMSNADHFKSDPIDPKSTLKPAQFTIHSGQKDYSINFDGGSLDHLIEVLNKTSSDVLTASRTDGDNGSYIDIQGKNMGKDGAIQFSGDTDFLKSLGLIQNAQPSYDDIHITSPQRLSGSHEAEELLANGSLTLRSGEYATKQLLSPKDIDDAQLWVYLKVDPSVHPNKPSSQKSPISKDSADNPIEGMKDKIWVGDSDLMGNGIYIPEDWSTSQGNSPGGDSSPSSLLSNKNSSPISISIQYADGKDLAASTTWDPSIQEIQILKVSAPKGKIASIKLSNNSADTVSITKAQIVSLNKGQSEHKNSITKAQNAIINYKGLDYERKSNTIDDIVPGTLTLKGESTKPVSLSTDYDFNSVLDQVKQWIIAYNNTMDYIKNTTKEDFSVISRMNRDRNQEITDKREAYGKLSDDQKSKMSADGSLFEGFLAADSSIAMLKEKLQTFTKKQYSTDLKEKLMLLSQLGIAVPNASQLANMSDNERENYRAGYLDFPKNGQEQFLKLLKESPQPVQQFFFQRINGSHIYNAGMMFDYDQLLSLYLQRYSGKLPGFFLAKSQLLDTQIQGQDKKLSDLDDKMKQDEDKLRNDFSKVYDAQNQAKSLEQQFSRFGRGS